MGSIPQTVAIAGMMTRELNDTVAFVTVIDIGNRSTTRAGVVDVPAGDVAVFSIFVQSAGRRRCLSAAPVKTGGEFPGSPGVAEDWVTVGSGGVVGDFNVERRVTLMVHKVGNVDFGWMVEWRLDDDSKRFPAGPSIIVTRSELHGVGSNRG